MHNELHHSWARTSLTPNARTVLEKRYLKDGETPEEMFYRVAETVAMVERQYGRKTKDINALVKSFYDMMVNLEFLPNSPTLMNAGTEKGQLSACFVLPVGDSMEEIFDAIKNAAIIHKSGGGTGFSFSRLRPANSTVRSTGGVASGPVSFMKVFNAATEAVKQGGTRRGANMGLLRVDHPDILEFIKCKEDNKEITNFNISVGITDAFMKAVERNQNYDLVDPRTKEAMGQLSAVDVFNNIVDHAWRNGEPGIVFLDRMNEDNPTPHLGEIEAPNPCSEQPLLPNEACNLGSINLKKMVRYVGGQAHIDWLRLGSVTRLAVRFLDNVIDANVYPLPEIDAMVKGNRKIGLGVMGFADLLIMLKVPYNSELAVKYAKDIMDFIQEVARKESEALAKARGAFPNFKGSVYDEAIRNATVTTIAPTGTLSMIAGVSGGIEPIFAVAYTKTVMDGTSFVEVNPLFEQYAQAYCFYSEALMEKIAECGTVCGLSGVPDWVQEIFVTAQEITPEWHVRMQAAFQEFTDNAISKTINFPFEATREDVAKAYRLANELNCKGLTVYRDGSREEQVLTTGTTSKKVQEASSRALIEMADKITPRPRPDVTMGATEKIKIGCGNLYVSVNADVHGICEVFTNTGRAGGCSSQSEATARLISIALRAGVSADAIIEQVKGIRCPACMRRDGVKVTSCPDAIARTIKKYSENITPEIKAPEVKAPEKVASSTPCPECGMPINHESGCVVCLSCGFSKCST